MITKLSENLWRISGETNGYLIVKHQRSLLIDCPAGDIAARLREAGLPHPDIVLHTQVQEEHCGEWMAFPDAQVWIHRDAVDIATRSPKFFQEAQTVWADDREWSTGGEEKYGLGGCVTERPPVKPLNVTRTFAVGDVLEWEGITLTVVALPVSGKRSVGFLWEGQDIAFTGDLVHDGGCVVNFYDLEIRYGGFWATDKTGTLEAVQRWNVKRFLPTTGPVIENPMADVERVSDLFKNPNRVGTAAFPPEKDLQNFPVIRSFGRYREVAKGIYQNNNYGNVILFVDDQGHGMMIDPDNCVWLNWADSVASMHEDLDLLERETGVKTIDIALMTHPHGDHIQYCDLLRERYGTKILATPDVAAQMERPEDFPYPCMVDWYNFPFKSITVDERLTYEKEFDWRGIKVLPMYTPGHCIAHTAFGLIWNGERVICTGDVIQYGGGNIGVGLPFCYNGNDVPEHSPLVAMKRVVTFNPDLICCGHSRSCRDPDHTIFKTWTQLWEKQIETLKGYVPDRDLHKATTPPGF